MAKVIGPVLSLSASKSMKDTVTFQRRPSGHAIYLKTSPGDKNPFVPSAGQLAQRVIIGQAVASWKALSPSEKAQWDEDAITHGYIGTGYHYYISRYTPPPPAPVYGTFGSLLESVAETVSSTNACYSSPAMPTQNGQLIKLTARVHLSATGSTLAKGVIYSNEANKPVVRLAVGDEVTINNTVIGWKDFPFSGVNKINLVAGTTYWLAVHWKAPGTPSIKFSRENIASKLASHADTYADGPINPWGSVSLSAGPFNCYGTYLVI